MNQWIKKSFRYGYANEPKFLTERTYRSLHRDSVSSARQLPRISSKILRCASYFQLDLFSVFGYPDETLSLVFDILHELMRRVCQALDTSKQVSSTPTLGCLAFGQYSHRYHSLHEHFITALKSKLTSFNFLCILYYIASICHRFLDISHQINNTLC